MIMRRVAGPLALLAAVLAPAAPIAAQQSRQSVPPPPRFAPAPSPTVPPEMRAAYRQFCGEENESVSIPETNGARMTFVTRRSELDVAALCFDSALAARIVEVDRIDHALMLLAFRPLEPFWPRMEAEWGSDLGLLREELSDRARTLTTAGWGLRMAGYVDRALGRAGALRDLGHYDEASAILDAAEQRLNEQLADNPQADLDFERGMIAAYRAGSVSRLEGDLAAAAVLERFLETFPRDSEHYTNPLINYAAYLAEAGENARSRQLIEPAYEQFRGADYSPQTYQTGGADREFAWIIACNRWRLEKVEAAQPYIAIVEYAEERPEDEYYAYVKPTTVIERRMYRCIGDAEGYFAQFTDGSLPLLHTAWLLLQPQWGGDDGPLPEWSVPGELADRFARRYRALPENLVPAMRRWGADRSGR